MKQQGLLISAQKRTSSLLFDSTFALQLASCHAEARTTRHYASRMDSSLGQVQNLGSLGVLTE